MSTVATVSTPAARAADLPALLKQAQDALADIENRFSVFKPDSELAQVNRLAGQEFFTLSPDIARVLRYALNTSRESGGAFDPTVGPLMAVWGFRGGEIQRVPGDDELAAARDQVGWTHVEWQAGESNRVRLARAGMKLDLGGIAKGYAVDVAFDRLRHSGFDHFLVDLGGNLRVQGSAAPHRGGWRTGVRDPFDTDALLGTLLLTNGEAVASSGNYERFVEIDGHRYGHIMDPRSGRPMEGMAGVTVIAPSGIECDALTKPMYILGPEKGRAVLALHPGCEALWVLEARPTRLVATPGFARRFQPLPQYQDSITTLESADK